MWDVPQYTFGEQAFNNLSQGFSKVTGAGTGAGVGAEV